MSRLAIEAGPSPIGIQHSITALGKFDGTVPVGTVTFANGLNKFPAALVGGLFDFENIEPVVIQRYHFEFGVSNVYTIEIVNLDAARAVIAGESVTVDTGTAVRAQSSSMNSPMLLLLPNQALKVTAATAAVMVGQVVITSARNS